MKLVSSSQLNNRRLKLLFWGGWATRKTETVLRHFPNVLIIDTEGNVDQVIGNPGYPRVPAGPDQGCLRNPERPG